MIKKASKLILNFIETNLTNSNTKSNPYTLNHINKWDSVLKSESKLYSNDTLANGIYYTCEAFNYQKQDGILVDDKRSIEELQKVYQWNDSTGESNKLKKCKVFAVVQNGIS
ncbi:MAG: hypothetical protein ACOVO1_06405 [Chitinophagaceae bacterium]